MRVLVTGGAGFIGSHLAAHYAARGAVRVLDNLRTGCRRNLGDLSVEWVEGSVTDRDVVRAAMQGVDTVFHLAALVSVPESMERPLDCLDINGRGTLIVLEEAARAGVRKLCFSSSSAVYGEGPVVPKTEDMTPDPRSPYAITKLDGEYYCGLFQRTGRLRTASLRYFNVFGPRQNPNSAYAAAVPIFIQRALRGEPLTVYGDGEQTRDFVHVSDVVAANAFLAEREDLSGVYNVGYGVAITVNALAARVLALTGSASPVVHAATRAGDVRHSAASIRALTAAGFHPTGTLERGLVDTVASLRA